MAKMLQAYFQTEDDALQAKDELIKLEAEKIEIGTREGHGEGSIPLAAPLLAGNGTAGGTGLTGAAGGTGGTGAPLFVLGAVDRETGGERKRDYPTVLSAEISEAHYDEAVESIKMNKGHIDA
jgi:hypothetical protein